MLYRKEGSRWNWVAYRFHRAYPGEPRGALGVQGARGAQGAWGARGAREVPVIPESPESPDFWNWEMMKKQSESMYFVWEGL